MLHRLSALLALSACVNAASANPVSVTLPNFQCAGMKESVRLPGKLSQLRKLGKLNDEQTVHVQEWNGYKAIEKLLRFNGLYVQVITFTNDPERYNLASVHIEAQGWSVSPIRVGSPATEVLTRLGAIKPGPNATWQFVGESDSLYVEARDGKVFRVVYECYTG